MKDTTNIKMRDISKNNKTLSRNNFHNLKIKYSKSTKYYNTKLNSKKLIVNHMRI